jgi:hypothetical protein
MLSESPSVQNLFKSSKFTVPVKRTFHSLGFWTSPERQIRLTAEPKTISSDCQKPRPNEDQIRAIDTIDNLGPSISISWSYVYPVCVLKKTTPALVSVSFCLFPSSRPCQIHHSFFFPLFTQNTSRASVSEDVHVVHTMSGRLSR